MTFAGMHGLEFPFATVLNGDHRKTLISAVAFYRLCLKASRIPTHGSMHGPIGQTHGSVSPTHENRGLGLNPRKCAHLDLEREGALLREAGIS